MEGWTRSPNVIELSRTICQYSNEIVDNRNLGGDESIQKSVKVFTTDFDLSLVHSISNHVLCIWHINKNMAANVKNIPQMKLVNEFFSQLISNVSELEFEGSYMNFNTEYRHYPGVLDNIENQWT
ncbi:hypothetical protein BC833DRAFT_570660 [Globomyces pollinis-pini]|nr:hypothetical protein BC833DRAFT_570660 [Globomyces pollinis-pini]